MSTWFDDMDDEGSGFCACGVMLEYGEDECPKCAESPHHRDCPCDECEAYWEKLCAPVDALVAEEVSEA